MRFYCELCADREADKQLSSLAGGRRLEAESECNWIPLHTRAIGAREERTQAKVQPVQLCWLDILLALSLEEEGTLLLHLYS